ncbi:Uncharacterized metal-binding protein [Thermoanaerobacter uzonensis DSM 18761]|jgi:uncharacterized metal-binding protein|uniref:Uncharacterized metal-binding protein n=1 Tax=Thermoanaerobacter uzonensis DSM 18761 TaxID=1123369 RepID=A0A1M4ZLW3_9THEO|nr:DUF1847 domain-containing protein [Thermoanaerobacter uzonensis]SHF19080.1 Uncharacterized metal-binding protein [Thermoanaerobacter uzonensis DSM 18761]
MKSIYTCGVCPKKPCAKGETNFPKNCPTVERRDIVEQSVAIYKQDEMVHKIMNFANTLPKKKNGELRSRAEEIIEFIKQMGFKNIGVAFCYSTSKEAKQFVKLLEQYDLKIVPVCCKVGSIDIEDIDIQKDKEGFVATCNPITQAEIMNQENTELNVVIGLCVGHDILFNKYSKGLVTTLVAKDRKYAHCPVKGLEAVNV